MRKALYLLFCTLFAISCNKDELQPDDHSSDDFIKNEQCIELGIKLKNPYSVANMQKALENMKANNLLKSTNSDLDSITATHYYVKFLPQDFTELEQLYTDTLLELFDYPLDYDIVAEGTFYHDPSIPEGKPTYQYTVVPIDYVFSDVQYEILEDIYLPKEDDDGLKSGSFFDLLEYESMKLTGNLKENEIAEKGLLPSKKNPTGYIKVYNTHSKALEGVKRIKVRTQRFAKIGWAYTNVVGYYRINVGYRYHAHYSVTFVNESGYKIWGNQALSAPAVYNMGKHSKSGHSRNFYTNSVAWLWSTVNNGIYAYREICPKYGVNKPPSNMRIWTTRTGGDYTGSAPMAYQVSMTAATLKDFLTAHGVRHFLAYMTNAMPDIFILRDFKSTKEAYSTIFHECAHASHYTKVGKEYWMKYARHIVNNGGYGNGTETDAGYCGVGEMWANYYGYISEYYYFKSANFVPWEDWYHPGILMQLDIDYFSTYQIFNCLSTDVTNHNKLKNKLIATYGQNKIVNKAFSDYGF